MERKVSFVLDASNRGGGRTLVQRPTPPRVPPDKQGARAFTDGGRGLHVETAQSALTVMLKLEMQWSDQHHLDCFKYSSSSVPGLVCSHFLEVNSQNCGSLCHDYNLVIT